MDEPIESTDVSFETVTDDKGGDLRNVPKEILKEFIEEYKKHPSLWQIKNKEVYNNKKLKYKGWQQLVAVWRTLDNNADIKMVKAKVQSLRGSFRKEMKKVEKSKTTGSGTDDIYVPQLWYYKHMMFINEHEIPTESVDNITTLSEDNTRETQPENDDEEGSGVIDEAATNSSTRNAKRDFKESVCTKVSGSSPHPRKKMKKTEEEERRQFLKACTTVLESKGKENTSPNYPFGMFLVNKLDKVTDDMQRLYAETLINQVASYATMGYLNDHTRINLNTELADSRNVTPMSSIESSDSYSRSYHIMTVRPSTPVAVTAPVLMPTTPLSQGFLNNESMTDN